MSYLCTQKETFRMQKFIYTILIALIALTSCQRKQTEEKVSDIDTTHVMMTQIQKCSRLYTAEVHVRKIVTHDDQLQLKGSLFKNAFNIKVPGTTRKIAIPIDATIKAYIDFEGFSAKNVKRHGDQIEIILPDPKLTLTSSKINHEDIHQVVSLARSNFSDAELSKLEQLGRESIIHDIPNLDIIEQARQSAAHTLIPMIEDMGFKAENVKISFRKKFTAADLRSLLDQGTLKDKSTVEKKNK